MRILIGVPDRDLLRCCAALLAGPERQVETAFDGTQVLTRLAEGDWSLLILSRSIPRIGCRRIVGHCNEAGLPVLVLTTRPPTLGLLLEPVLANAYLPLPFLPEALERSVDRVLAAAASQETLALEGRQIPVKDFRLGASRLSLEELGCLKALADGHSAAPGPAVLGALNEKLRREGFASRLRYRAKEGYRLVTEDE